MAFKICEVLDNYIKSTNASRIAKYQGRRSPLRCVKSSLASDYESPETKLFKAGLKHYRPHEERLIKGTRRSPNHDYHDTIDYERVQLLLVRVA